MTRRLHLALFTLALLCASAHAGEAEDILKTTGVQGGLVVHVGCGDGALTAALRANNRYLVHGLDTDITAARKHIQSLGLYGPVSVARWDGGALPYADNLVNLVVAEAPCPMAEMLRVLAPNGVTYVKKNGAWAKTVKPVPDDIDEWTHYLHGPDNNGVARDRRVASPRRLQWVDGPLWCRSHEFVSSFAAMVTAGGRTFYVMDEGLPGVTDKRLPERWTLIARDAFNGVLLWQRPLPDWRSDGWKNSSLRGRPGGVPRRLVADAGQLYATFGHTAPLTVLDTATGKTVRTVKGTERTEEILLLGRTVVLRLAPAPGESGAIAAVDADTGALRWRTATAQFTPQSLTATKDRVVFHNRMETVCLTLADGKEVWRTGVARQGRPKNVTIILHDNTVLETDGSRIAARELANGKTRWTVRTGGGSMRGNVLFVAQGLAWHAAGAGIAGHDLATGKVAKNIDASGVQTPGHHLRCYESKATERYLITAWRGAEFISLTGDVHAQNDWLRGPCRYGLMPANGMLYAPPHQCFCYPGVTEPGLKALTSATDAELAALAKAAPTNRLEKGPAFGGMPNAKSQMPNPQDWPTYRHDPRRTGATSSPAPAALAPRWQAKLTGPVTPPVVARGTLYVAAKDTHTIHAFDAETGKPLWVFT
ncbi:PQQ-binding-like beta-propeller repeat protein, partial [bacterium]|nr:PQQ-binding-like beta-propeller repeat protein [bacterium]